VRIISVLADLGSDGTDHCRAGAGQDGTRHVGRSNHKVVRHRRRGTSAVSIPLGVAGLAGPALFIAAPGVVLRPAIASLKGATAASAGTARARVIIDHVTGISAVTPSLRWNAGRLALRPLSLASISGDDVR
jgi:hypothetical protein